MGKVVLRYVGELPVRITHWVNVLAIITFCVTGLFIGAPLAHHLAMWMLIGFIINHIYRAWLVDISVKGGVVSGIFSGFKPVEK
jgi:Ni,Fe-hydrogenase I cytochrome b subunit